MNVTGTKYSYSTLVWLLLLTSSTFILSKSYASESTTSGTQLPLLGDSTESPTTTTSSILNGADGEFTSNNSIDLNTEETFTSEDGLIEVTISNNHKPPRGSIIVTNEVSQNVQEVSQLSTLKPETVTSETDDRTTTRIDNVPTTLASIEVNTENESNVSTTSQPSSTESSVAVSTSNEVEGDPVTSTESSTSSLDGLVDDAKCFNTTKEWQLSLLRRIQVTQDNVKFQLDSTLGPEGASRRDLLRRALANLMTLGSRVSSRDPETSEEESQVGLLMSSEGRLNRIGWVVYRNRKDWEFNDCCYQGINFMCGSRNNTPFFDPR